MTLFAGKMAGGTDDDETILKSFEVNSSFNLNNQRKIRNIPFENPQILVFKILK